MNRRNADFILPQNERRLYPLVDNKLKTKELLEAHGLPCPRSYFAIQDFFDLRLLKSLQTLKQFVVKPARGAEGRGILVLVDKKGEDCWIRSTGEEISRADLEYHVSNILSGLFSLGGNQDAAFLEYLITTHLFFQKITYQGVPDIRVVLYRGIPVMGMLRLPTKESEGRANLHQGAVGVGIQLRDGKTMGGVRRDQWVSHHPDTHERLEGMIIPFWDELLDIAVRAYEVFGMGYVGIDFAIDQLLGPLILELNARPGLNIQLANRAGLLSRLMRVDSHLEKYSRLGWQERIEFAKGGFQSACVSREV